MSKIVAGAEADRVRLRSSLVIAVDLGFAENDESCGVAWRRPGRNGGEMELSFGDCLSFVAELVASVPDVAALIVEAPLSGCFNDMGNPIAREYDSKWNGKSLESGRGWYYGAGGAVALGAIFFLRRLRELTVIRPATIVLFEGFVSFKHQRTTHVDDARTLLELFASDKPGCRVVAPTGGARVTVLELLGEQADDAPLVLMRERPPPAPRRSRRRPEA
jgi:hypothetical protein